MSDCLEWTGTKNSYGYGVFKVGKRQYMAHRIAYEKRHTFGSKSPHAKLTEDQVRQIIADESPKKALARLYGVSDKVIRNIKSGKKWAHLHY